LLAEALGLNTTLHSINLECNDLGVDGARALAAYDCAPPCSKKNPQNQLRFAVKLCKGSKGHGRRGMGALREPLG
jgi:hypothetical protein